MSAEETPLSPSLLKPMFLSKYGWQTPESELSGVLVRNAYSWAPSGSIGSNYYKVMPMGTWVLSFPDDS